MEPFLSLALPERVIKIIPHRLITCPFVKSALECRKPTTHPDPAHHVNPPHPPNSGIPLMRRREIPLIEMFDYGQDHLRRRGFVVMPFLDSLSLDPMRLGPHYHDFYQISLLSGGCTMMHDFQETKARGDTLFFLSPGQVHTMRPGKRIQGSILSFTREFADHPSGLLNDLPIFQPGDTSPWLKLDAESALTAHAIFDEMLAEYTAGRPHTDEVLRSLLILLLMKSSRWRGRNPVETGAGKSARLLRRFHQQVESHFLDWQSLKPYARELGVTANHLNDVIKEATGISAGEHIRSRRLLDAKRLLLHSHLSVSEIGYRLGFKDPSYFSRFFRRYEATTPAMFREKIREKYQQ